MGTGDDLLTEGHRAGLADRVQPVDRHHREDVNELAIAVAVPGQALAQPRHGGRQVPVLEGRAVAQRPGFALECCHVVPGVIERTAALEASGVLADDLSTAQHHDPLRIRAHGCHLSNVARFDAVPVAFEVHQADRGDSAGPLSVAVKGCRHRAQTRALLVPCLYDLAFGSLRVRPLACKLPATLTQVRVELGEIGEAQLGRKYPLANVAHLILHLALFPAGRRRAGRGLHKVVIAHHQEAAVVAALAADEDGIDRRFQVVVDAAPGYPAQEAERSGVCIEHHLLALARISHQEERAAVTQPHMRNLHDLLKPAKLDVLVTPVKLVRLTGGKALRDEGGRYRMTASLKGAHMPPQRGGRTAEALQPQRLIHPLRRAPLARRQLLLCLQPRLQRRDVRPHLRLWLAAASILKGNALKAQCPLDRVPREPQVPGNRADRLPVHQPPTADLPDRLHAQHPDSPRTAGER